MSEYTNEELGRALTALSYGKNVDDARTILGLAASELQRRIRQPEHVPQNVGVPAEPSRDAKAIVEALGALTAQVERLADGLEAVDHRPARLGVRQDRAAMICDRCHQKSFSLSGSYFNTEMICRSCDDKERQHPDYERAREVENEAVRRGDYNFPGIGKPRDL